MIKDKKTEKGPCESNLPLTVTQAPVQALISPYPTVTQCVPLGTVASASPGSLLEMQMYSFTPEELDQALGKCPATCNFNKHNRKLQCMLKSENESTINFSVHDNHLGSLLKCTF